MQFEKGQWNILPGESREITLVLWEQQSTRQAPFVCNRLLASPFAEDTGDEIESFDPRLLPGRM